MDLDRIGQTSVEATMLNQLSRANRALGGVFAVIAHKLESPCETLVSDAIVARLRGMLDHIAKQILTAASTGSPERHPDQADIDALTESLANNSALLSHLYGLAMEGHLTERLERQSALDPVLSPLLQDLIGSERPSIAGLAMEFLATQSRFIQTQRRMQSSIRELPVDLFADLIGEAADGIADIGPEFSAGGLASLQRGYDEGATRLGLLSRIMDSVGDASEQALELDRAGFALFVSGLAAQTEQARELAVLACHERPAIRLALSLRAVGLDQQRIENQLLILDRADRSLDGIGKIAPERSAFLLDGLENQSSPAMPRG